VKEASPLAAGSPAALPRFFTVNRGGPATPAAIIASLTPDGCWLSPLGNNSHVYKADGSSTPTPGDFSRTVVGDETDTSPFPDSKLVGISTAAYIRNMSALILALEKSR
jgi:hypothetical protein